MNENLISPSLLERSITSTRYSAWSLCQTQDRESCRTRKCTDRRIHTGMSPSRDGSRLCIGRQDRPARKELQFFRASELQAKMNRVMKQLFDTNKVTSDEVYHLSFLHLILFCLHTIFNHIMSFVLAALRQLQNCGRTAWIARFLQHHSTIFYWNNCVIW